MTDDSRILDALRAIIEVVDKARSELPDEPCDPLDEVTSGYAPSTSPNHDAEADAWRYNAPSVATSPVPKMPPINQIRYTYRHEPTVATATRSKYPALRSLLAWVPRPNKNKKEN